MAGGLDPPPELRKRVHGDPRGAGRPTVRISSTPPRCLPRVPSSRWRCVVASEHPPPKRAPTKGKRGKRRAARRGERDDRYAEAFQDHGIEPGEPGARERLLEALVLQHYPGPARGRPKGSTKPNRTRNRRIGLLLNWLQLKQQLDGKRANKLLTKQKSVTSKWLRQSLREASKSEGLSGLSESEGINEICGPRADGSYTLETRDGDIFATVVLGV